MGSAPQPTLTSHIAVETVWVKRNSALTIPGRAARPALARVTSCEPAGRVDLAILGANDEQTGTATVRVATLLASYVPTALVARRPDATDGFAYGICTVCALPRLLAGGLIESHQIGVGRPCPGRGWRPAAFDPSPVTVSTDAIPQNPVGTAPSHEPPAGTAPWAG